MFRAASLGHAYGIQAWDCEHPGQRPAANAGYRDAPALASAFPIRELSRRSMPQTHIRILSRILEIRPTQLACRSHPFKCKRITSFDINRLSVHPRGLASFLDHTMYTKNQDKTAITVQGSYFSAGRTAGYGLTCSALRGAFQLWVLLLDIPTVRIDGQRAMSYVWLESRFKVKTRYITRLSAVGGNTDANSGHRCHAFNVSRQDGKVSGSSS